MGIIATRTWFDGLVSVKMTFVPSGVKFGCG